MRSSNPGKSSPARPTSLGGKLAPAIGLLLLGDTASAGIDDSVSIPEPATLGLLAIGAAAGGAAAYVRNRRGRK